MTDTMNRYVCTAESPWTPDKGRAMHPDAKSIYDEGDYEQFKCPHCGVVTRN